MPAAAGDGAGRDDQYFLLAPAAAGEVVHQRLEPGAADVAGGIVHQQRRADLDDEPAGLGEIAAHGE
jgi:hypothetical protein